MRSDKTSYGHDLFERFTRCCEAGAEPRFRQSRRGRGSIHASDARHRRSSLVDVATLAERDHDDEQHGAVRTPVIGEWTFSGHFRTLKLPADST